MLRGVWAVTVAIVSTALFSIPVIVTCLFRPRSDVIIPVGRLWSRINLAACGVRADVAGAENARARLPCIFLSNHLSIVDIWVLMLVVPESTRFVAKESLFRIPLLGRALRSGGFIPIDRGRLSRAIKSLDLAAERIASGRSVLLFPEGTRSRDGKLAPFKKGAFHLALKAGVPVVPVAITGSFDIVAPRTVRVRPGRVRVAVEAPIDVRPYVPSDVDGLAERVREAIRRHVEPDPPTSADDDPAPVAPGPEDGDGRSARAADA